MVAAQVVVDGANSLAGRGAHTFGHFNTFSVTPSQDAKIESVELPPSLQWDRPPPATDSLTHGGTNRCEKVTENVIKKKRLIK
eukprot:6460600-Pyramimonas_sp.AAC.2